KHGWVDGARARDVPLLRLDRFLAEHAAGLRLAAMKIDVEGVEDRVVGGTAESVCTMLAAHRYEAWRIDADGRLRTPFTVDDAARLDAIVNVAFTASDAPDARPEIFG